MMGAGLNVARFNFSHGDQAEQKERLLRLRKVAQKNDRVIGVIGVIRVIRVIGRGVRMNGKEIVLTTNLLKT